MNSGLDSEGTPVFGDVCSSGTDGSADGDADKDPDAAKADSNQDEVDDRKKSVHLANVVSSFVFLIEPNTTRNARERVVADAAPRYAAAAPAVRRHVVPRITPGAVARGSTAGAANGAAHTGGSYQAVA